MIEGEISQDRRGWVNVEAARVQSRAEQPCNGFWKALVPEAGPSSSLPSLALPRLFSLNAMRLLSCILHRERQLIMPALMSLASRHRSVCGVTNNEHACSNMIRIETAQTLEIDAAMPCKPPC